MWGTIGALLTRAGEALGIELPESLDLTAVGDTATGAAEAVASQAGEVIAPLTSVSTDLGIDVASVGETVTGALDAASDTTALPTDLVAPTPQ